VNKQKPSWCAGSSSHSACSPAELSLFCLLVAATHMLKHCRSQKLHFIITQQVLKEPFSSPHRAALKSSNKEADQIAQDDFVFLNWLGN
jgi:hypothetical protein